MWKETPKGISAFGHIITYFSVHLYHRKPLWKLDGYFLLPGCCKLAFIRTSIRAFNSFYPSVEGCCWDMSDHQPVD